MKNISRSAIFPQVSTQRALAICAMSFTDYGKPFHSPFTGTKGKANPALLAAQGAVCTAGAHEELFGRAAINAVQRELPRAVAAQFEEKLAAVIGQGIDRVDESHARGLIQMSHVRHALQKHANIAIQVGL